MLDDAFLAGIGHILDFVSALWYDHPKRLLKLVAFIKSDTKTVGHSVARPWGLR